MRPPESRTGTLQSASEAMAVWQRATRENRPVGLDGQGNVAVIFGASIDGFSGPASKRNAAKETILAKMRSEISLHGSWNGTVVHSVMASRLPSLGRFLSDDQIGSLGEEWKTLKTDAAAALALADEVLQKRTAIAERVAPFLPPGLGVSVHDGGLSWLSHTFTDARQQQIGQRLTSLAGESVDPELQLDPQMLRDLNRDTYDIILPASESVNNAVINDSDYLQQLDRRTDLTPKAKRIIRQLYTFCRGNLGVMATLSKLMNQYAISALMKADKDELTPASGAKVHFHADSKKANSQSVFRLRRTAEGNVLLFIAHMKKGSRLVDDQFQTLCHFKPGPKSEVADESHFNFRCHTEVLLRDESLRQQKINPEISRKAAADYVLDIDWAA